MDRDANYVAVGAFVLLVLAMATVFVLWYTNTHERREYQRYEVYFAGSVSGLTEGSTVRYLGVTVGRVARIRLDPRAADRVQVLIDVDKATPVDADTLARLTMQGVTGLLFIQLDYFPDTVAHIVGGGEEYMEIPTLPTPLEELQGTLKQFVAKLNQLNLSDLVDRATVAFDAVQRLVSAPETKNAIASLNQALLSFNKLAVAVTGKVDPLSQSVEGATDTTKAAAAEVEQASKTVRTLIEPGSPVEVKLNQTLDDVSAAARSLRLLADALERDPSSIVRCKDYEPRKP